MALVGIRCGTLVVRVGLATLALTGCAEDYPAAASLRAEMGAAVRAAASVADGGPGATVQYELQSRCGPNDQVLDGLTLQASAPSLTAADRPTVLDRMTDALTDEGLQVERLSPGPERLRASPDSGAWTLTVAENPTADELVVHASGVVIEDQEGAGITVTNLCG